MTSFLLRQTLSKTRFRHGLFSILPFNSTILKKKKKKKKEKKKKKKPTAKHLPSTDAAAESLSTPSVSSSKLSSPSVNPSYLIPKPASATLDAKWDSLPQELLVSVFVRLGAAELAFGAPMACKAWHMAASQPAVWRAVDLRGWQELRRRLIAADVKAKSVDFGDLARFVANHGGKAVELLWFSDYPVLDADFLYVSYRCPNIKFFYLRLSSLIRNDTFQVALDKWKLLEGLDIDDTALRPEVLKQISISCKNFSYLRVSNKLRLTAAHNIVKFLPKLKSLNISEAIFLNKALIVILQGCEDLESLDITGCGNVWLDTEIEKLAANLKEFRRDAEPVQGTWQIFCPDCVDNDYYELGVVNCYCNAFI